jgi:hypothetical protein
MVARDEVAPSAGTVANDGSSKLTQLLRKRLRQLAWATAAVAALLVVGAGGVAIWWLTSLNGLPDIGDPFDVSAFLAIKIPDEQNAFVYYRRAQDALSPFHALSPKAISAASTAAWSKLDPKLHEWVEANDAALRLLQTGADQADGILLLEGKRDAGHDATALGHLGLLALLQGARHAEKGDMAGAWTYYRSVLRMMSHVSRRISVLDRWFASHNFDSLKSRVEAWASDPRTTIQELRLALDDATGKGMTFDSDSFSLKREYLEHMRLLDDPDGYLAHGSGADLVYRFGDMQLPPDAAERVYAVRRFLWREPERSRRVLRLLFANWLARRENARAQQTKPAVKASFHWANQSVSIPLYRVGPDAPAAARVRSPQEVAEWIVSTHDVRDMLEKPWLNEIHLRELKIYHDVVVLLADELYRRERGKTALSDEALVGTYLKRLPDDGSEELGDETTPIVSD